MLKAKLMVVGGDAVQTEVQLKLPTTIGRGREANLTVPHALVSRRHTEIIERDGRLFVNDLGSLNGTFVNNQRITEETPLDPDQLLTLGNITFRAVYEIGDHRDTDRISVNDTEVIDIQQSDTHQVIGAAADSNSSMETVPVDSLSQLPTGQAESGSSTNNSGDQKKTAYDKAAEAAGSAAIQSPSAFRSESTHAFVHNPHADVVATESVETDKLDSVKLDLGGESNQAGEKDSELGSFLRRLPR